MRDCALPLWTAQGLARQDIACPAGVRAAYPDCGLVLLAEDDRTAIDVYQCHPNALVPKPGYLGSDWTPRWNACFSFWQKGLGWLDLPSAAQARAYPAVSVVLCRGGLDAAASSTVLAERYR